MVNEKSVTGRAVVLGAGTMGGGIAAQLANAGWQVTLLDLPDAEKRNRVAEAGLERVLKNRPPLLFLPEFAARIHAGNTEDNLDTLRDADWVVEAVAERVDVKKAILAQIEANIGPHTVISSNTSGLSLREMSAERSPEFRRRFLGTHFLNPPRYLKLLEIVPLPDTEPEIVAGFVRFAEQVLGHRCVLARDTPGFISTRLWITHLLETIHLAVEQGMTIEEVDALTGPMLGRPRSATFRMADIVGLDIIASVAKNQYDSLPDDPRRTRLLLPDALSRLIAVGRLGEKTGAGFYKREGKEILTLDLTTRDYRPRQEASNTEIESLLKRPLAERLAALESYRQEGWGRFVNDVLDSLISYARAIAPEIANDALSIDRVMQWGFGWERGPFEIEAARIAPALPSLPFYVGSGAKRKYRVFGKEELQPMPDEPEVIVLADVKAAGKTVLETPEASLLDLGDGVACLEYHTKMNTFSPAMVAVVNATRERAEKDFAALVIGNQAAHFSAGYNLNLFLEAIAAQDWGVVDTRLKDVQDAFMRWKVAKIPVVAAVHGYTLGAGCEGALHCHALQASPELSMGLPEFNIGAIPAGGGAKEMLARAMAGWTPDSDPFPRVERVFDLIVSAKISANAEEARKMGLLRDTDGISRNADRLLYDAKMRALSLANAGFRPPVPQSIWVLGEEGLARLRMKIHGLYRSGAMTEHDRRIADGVAYVLSGGALPYAQEVSEDYLLRLEREVFVDLAREPKSAERMRHILATGKPLRN